MLKKFKKWFSCMRCHGTKNVTVAGELYSREWLRENRPSDYADILVNGGWLAPAITKVCPRCESATNKEIK